MGKETCSEPSARKHAKSDKPAASRQHFTREQLDEEAAQCWASARGAVLQSQVKEDGKVIVIIRSEEKYVYYLCSGFAGNGNKFTALYQRLVDTDTISKTAVITNLFSYKDSIWNAAEMESAQFDSGDTFMLIIRNCAAAECPKRRKEIKPQRKLLKAAAISLTHRRAIKKLS